MAQCQLEKLQLQDRGIYLVLMLYMLWDQFGLEENSIFSEK